MTKPRGKNREELQAEIEDGKKKIRQFENREKMLRHTLPSYYAEEMKALYNEMTERKTVEAKIYKAIDSLEALIQHNASDLSTWIPKEYKLNLTYADDRVSFSEYLTTLRQAIREDTLAKIEK